MTRRCVCIARITWSGSGLGSEPAGLRRGGACASRGAPRGACGRAPPEWTDTRSENGVLGAAWLQCHGSSEGPEMPDASSRVRRAAPGLQMQPDELLVARRGATKAAL